MRLFFVGIATSWNVSNLADLLAVWVFFVSGHFDVFVVFLLDLSEQLIIDTSGSLLSCQESIK